MNKNDDDDINRGLAAAPRQKRRLTDLAKEYGLPFEQLKIMVFKDLEESMLSKRGKTLWVDADGQRVLEELIPMPRRHRGRVLKAAPNPRFVYAYIQELQLKVAVQVPRNVAARGLVGKTIYFEAIPKGEDNFEYVYTRPPLVG